MSKNNAGSFCSPGNLGRLSLVVVGIAIICTVNTAPYTEIVRTSSGPIRGEELTFEGTLYKAFKGIPYAAPPVGDLKFKAPEPPRKWTSVRDTRSYGNICHQPQLARAGNLIKMDLWQLLKIVVANIPNIPRNVGRLWSASEDCLTLNVFTQSLRKNDLKPVLFWIHGGGFATGDGSDEVYGPHYLVQEDIVVVTINYRLGPLGFLATNTSDATGNWGMKDQVAALKWVQDNIAQFGGDPNQVTIYGESAGGASVHLHLFSPLSKGLFQKAIPASGTAINRWALTDQQDRFSRNLARLLGASKNEIENPEERIQFLQSVDSKAMSDLQFDVNEEEDTVNPFFSPMPFVPVIEPPGTQGAFLTEDPRKLLHQGNFTKVPMMIGATDLEGGIMYMGLGRYTTPEGIKEFEENLCLILPKPLKEGVITKNDCSKVADYIKEIYFDGKSLERNLKKFIHFLGDLLMVKGVHAAQRTHAKYATKNTPLYNYYFTFDGEWNLVKKLLQVTPSGAVHGDDLTYVFKPRMVYLVNLEASSREVITKNRMINFVTNFVKYGNPTPSVSDLIPVQWEPAEVNKTTTMFIGDDLKLEKEFLKTRMDLWNQLYLKYTGFHFFN